MRDDKTQLMYTYACFNQHLIDLKELGANPTLIDGFAAEIEGMQIACRALTGCCIRALIAPEGIEVILDYESKTWKEEDLRNYFEHVYGNFGGWFK